MLFKPSMQLLNEPCPGRTTLSLDLILFKSEVTSILTLSLATSLNEFITGEQNSCFKAHRYKEFKCYQL